MRERLKIFQPRPRKNGTTGTGGAAVPLERTAAGTRRQRSGLVGRTREGLSRPMILDRLPPRITGFFDRADPPRALDRKAFKTACYAAAVIERGSVEKFDLSLSGRSYYAATMRTETDHVSVLCNSVYPYLAFVRGSFGFTDLQFIEPASLASAFSGTSEFQPLSAHWLNSELHPDLLAGLAPTEMEQVKYWKPQRIGEVIFNYWD